jgi:SAM-dependent methyltransferase
MLQRARRNIPLEYQDRVEYVHTDIFGFEPSAPYDLVLCIGVLAHVDSIDRALEKVARCVKPGGRVVVQISDDDQVLLKLLRWLYATRTTVSRSCLRSHAMTLSEVVAILRRHRLEVMDLRRHLLLLFPGMTRVLGKWLIPYDEFTQRHHLLAKHAGDVIVVCTKASHPVERPT